MATDHIRYDVLARDALRGVLRRVAGARPDCIGRVAGPHGGACTNYAAASVQGLRQACAGPGWAWGTGLKAAQASAGAKRPYRTTVRCPVCKLNSESGRSLLIQDLFCFDVAQCRRTSRAARLFQVPIACPYSPRPQSRPQTEMPCV